MVDDSRSFFDNNWRHHDITAIVKDYLCYRLLLDFARLLTIHVFCALRGKIDEFGFCQKIQHYEVIMTSNYVIVSIMICLDAGNDEYIILYNFVAVS